MSRYLFIGLGLLGSVLFWQLREVHAGCIAGAGLVPRAAIQEAVAAYVRDRTKGSAEEVAIEFTGVPDSVPVSDAGYTLCIDANNVKRLRGSVSVELEVRVRDRIERRISISFAVRTHATVLVAARQLDQHAAVTPTDVREERLETTLFKADFLADPANVTTMRTRRMIAKGAVLYPDLFEPYPMVTHGDVVTLRVRRGAVLLSTQAVAKEDGWKGELITVQKLGTHERIRARVENATTVELTTQ